MVSVICCSVKESKLDVASSNTKSDGLRSKARAMDRRCFSPAGQFYPALANYSI